MCAENKTTGIFAGNVGPCELTLYCDTFCYYFPPYCVRTVDHSETAVWMYLTIRHPSRQIPPPSRTSRSAYGRVRHGLAEELQWDESLPIRWETKRQLLPPLSAPERNQKVCIKNLLNEQNICTLTKIAFSGRHSFAFSGRLFAAWWMSVIT